MTSLSSDPLNVALVQAATALPFFVFALPAGALADIFDRRVLIISAQLISVAGAALLATLTFAGLTGPLTLMALTAVVAAGAALSAPAFQAIVPELVSEQALQDAVAFSALSFNIARAVGPALGGIVIAVSGPGAVFAANAVLILSVVIVMIRWRRKVAVSALPSESVFGAIFAGLRYAAFSHALRRVLIRSAGFYVFACAVWALLPLIARQTLELNPVQYGLLFGSIGSGAIVGTICLKSLRRRVGFNGVTVLTPAILAIGMVALSLASSLALAMAALFLVGFSWISMLSSLNGSVQAAAPAWVKARALALLLVIFQGAMAGGAALWGVLAKQISLGEVLQVSAVGVAIVGALLARLLPIDPMAMPDLTLTPAWPVPILPANTDSSLPTVVTVEYVVRPECRERFIAIAYQLRDVRLRDGGQWWNLAEDAGAPNTFVESFAVSSWIGHLRQHVRVTLSDWSIYREIDATLTGTNARSVRHFTRVLPSV